MASIPTLKALSSIDKFIINGAVATLNAPDHIRNDSRATSALTQSKLAHLSLTVSVLTMPSLMRQLQRQVVLNQWHWMPLASPSLLLTVQVTL